MFNFDVKIRALVWSVLWIDKLIGLSSIDKPIVCGAIPPESMLYDPNIIER